MQVLQRLQQQAVQSAQLQAQRQGRPLQAQQQQQSVPRSPPQPPPMHPGQIRPSSRQDQLQAGTQQKRLSSELQNQRGSSGSQPSLQPQQVPPSQGRPGSGQRAVQQQSMPQRPASGSTLGPAGLQPYTSMPLQQRTLDPIAQAQQARPSEPAQISSSLGDGPTGMASPRPRSEPDSSALMQQQSLSNPARRLSDQSPAQQNLPDRQGSAAPDQQLQQQLLRQQQQQQKHQALFRLQQQVLHCMTPQQRQNYLALDKVIRGMSPLSALVQTIAASCLSVICKSQLIPFFRKVCGVMIHIRRHTH